MCNHYDAVVDPNIIASFIPFLDNDSIEHLMHTLHKHARESTRGESYMEPQRRTIWPGQPAPIIRRSTKADESRKYEVEAARFGLIPHWLKREEIAGFKGSTFNARTETIATKPSFRDAFRKSQFCIVPAHRFYEPDWRSGKSVDTAIYRKDDMPLGIAGLWSQDQAGQLSFSMLTINAETHPIMKNFHRPEKEKRSIIILPPAYYEAWLSVDAAHAHEFFAEFPPELFQATPATGWPDTDTIPLIS
ncbi:MAG: SOS response-associated peptidase family protein [Corynebacterium sp.]|nr:SOS response-associated peptidase family protein [Corynebacterium sp.]